MARKHRKPTEFHETSYWQSYSDMMAGVLLMFVLIICGTLFVLMQVKNSYDASEIALQKREEELEQAIIENLGYLDLTEEQQMLLDAQQAQLEQQQAQLEEQQALLVIQQSELDAAALELTAKEIQILAQQGELAAQQAQLEEIIGVKKKIIADLSDAFANSNLSITVDEQTGAIIMDSSILFDYDSAYLSAKGMNALADFLPAYFDVVLSDEYSSYVSEIIIEGHTDTAGIYDYNLTLSQERAAAVANYCLGEYQDMFSSSRASRIRDILAVSGRSWSDPVYDSNGYVDDDASRRVEIKFRLSDEEMINEMLAVLEQYEEPATE